MAAHADPLPIAGWQAPDMSDSPLVMAAQGTIDVLSERGLIDAAHALPCQLLLTLAGRVALELERPKITIAATNLLKALLDALERLPVAAEQGADELEAFKADVVQAMREAA